MARQTREWIGATDDTAIPPRVKDRVFIAQNGKCANCNRKLAVCGEPVEFDHVVALINGGSNREANVQALCAMCHRNKTREDVAEKAVTYRKRSKHLGFKARKNLIPGSKGSGYRRKMDGTVVRVKE